MKNVEVDPRMHIFLTYYKGGIAVQWEKGKIFSE